MYMKIYLDRYLRTCELVLKVVGHVGRVAMHGHVHADVHTHAGEHGGLMMVCGRLVVLTRHVVCSGGHHLLKVIQVN